jgi:peptidoglycan biosynthesis protein MviN/MurJ (putative lipid II flippase)
LGAARRSLRVAVITSVITVVCALAGAVADGATGAVSGMAASAWVGVIFYWLELRAAMRESSSIPGHGSLRSLRTASRPTVGRPGKSEGHRK